MSCFTDIENKPDDWLVLDPLTVQKPIPKTGCDTNLIVLNYLSEFKTDALKLKVKDNLGLYVDNILSKNSTNPISNKSVYEEFNKLKSHVKLNTIDWLDASDMNNYVEEGTYNIKGKKTRKDDNLPIANIGDINAQLTVIVTENDNNIVITLVLNLNNNVGGEGNVYIRSCQNGEWKAWGKLQTNMEVGQVNTLDHLTDNGIYSGVFTDGTPTSAGTFYDTFVLIVINNYAVSIPTGNSQSISQLKYSLGLDGSISVASRKRYQNDYWDDWASLDEKSLVEEEKTRAEQAELDAINKGKSLALRELFISAGAEYNDSDEEVGKPIEIPSWTTYGETITETVTHKPKCYMVGLVGDLTEEEMLTVYNDGKWWMFANANGFKISGRTNLIPTHYIETYYKKYTLNQAFNLNDIMVDLCLLPIVYKYSLQVNVLKVTELNFLGQGSSFKRIIGIIDMKDVKTNQKINPTKLEYCTIINLCSNLNISSSPNISKDSIKYMIDNAAPKSAITITLHHDAYVRLTADQEVLDALTAKNETLTTEGKGGKISLVCATHSEEITPNA